MYLRSLPLLLAVALTLALPGRASAQDPLDCTDNESWLAMGPGFGPESRGIFSATSQDGDLLALHYGSFPGASDTSPRYRIIKWNGTTWSVVLGFDPSDGIGSYAPYKGDVYASGYFNGGPWEGNPPRFIRHNGTTQEVIATPFQSYGYITGMQVCNGDLWLAVRGVGSDQGRYGIARWDGTTVTMVDDNLRSGGIRTLYEWKGVLYVQGDFTAIAGIEAPGLAKWDGTSWKSLENDKLGMGTEGEGLIGYGDAVYRRAIKHPTRIIDSLVRCDGNGAASIPLPSGVYVNNAIFAEHDHQLYAAVMLYRTKIGDRYTDSTHAIYRWDGTRWHGVSRFDRDINALIDYKGTLVAGGFFTGSCGTSLDGAARLGPPTAPSGVPVPPDRPSITVYPNPAKESFRLRAVMKPGARVELRNLLGQAIRTYVSDGAAEMPIDVSGLAAGAYLIAVETGSGPLVERVTIVR